MAKKLDKILVVDVESTCWQGTPPGGQDSEIIEIGICTLDVASGERDDKRSILVKPERSKVSEFCTKLTTLTQEQVDKGLDFANACSILRNKCSSKERVWASYGDEDRRQFEKLCQARKITYPFGFSHINVKTLFAIIHGFPQEVEMEEALGLLGIPLEGTPHRGVDDAWNLAAIVSELLLKGRVK